MSTHNICFGCEIRKFIFCYTLITEGMSWFPQMGFTQGWLDRPVVQSVISLIADPGIVSSILLRTNTFVKIDHEIFLQSFPTCADSRRAVVSYKQKYVQGELFNSLV